MYFRIEQDHIDLGWQGRSYSTSDAPPKSERTYPVVVYLYDDDGELYLTVGCSCDEAAERAFDQLGPGLGVTNSKISMSRNEPAQPFIG